MQLLRDLHRVFDGGMEGQKCYKFLRLPYLLLQSFKIYKKNALFLSLFQSSMNLFNFTIKFLCWLRNFNSFRTIIFCLLCPFLYIRNIVIIKYKIYLNLNNKLIHQIP